RSTSCIISFFFNDTATPEIYTLSLHDALPIYDTAVLTSTDLNASFPANTPLVNGTKNFSVTLKTAGNATLTASNTTHTSVTPNTDRKSTRLNSSHVEISYAVFCLKKKKNNIII